MLQIVRWKMTTKDKDYIMQSFVAEEGNSFTVPGSAREIEYDYFHHAGVGYVRVNYLVPDGWDAIR